MSDATKSSSVAKLSADITSALQPLFNEQSEYNKSILAEIATQKALLDAILARLNVLEALCRKGGEAPVKTVAIKRAATTTKTKVVKAAADDGKRKVGPANSMLYFVEQVKSNTTYRNKYVTKELYADSLQQEKVKSNPESVNAAKHFNAVARYVWSTFTAEQKAAIAVEYKAASVAAEAEPEQDAVDIEPDTDDDN
jgi:hypothetical protein